MNAPETRGSRSGAAIDFAVANPLIAYTAVVLVQLRVLWRIWDYKDLNPGDTANYFLDAAGWVHGLHENITFSPLYDVFFGTTLWATKGIYAAAIIHRIAIVLIATVLVLALMRALLGPALGLLIALWWAVVPTNFNGDYEVHLFGVVPILIAAVIAARFPGRVGRGAVLAVLLGETILLRNELLLPTLILAAAVLLYEVRMPRSHRASLRGYLLSYGVPFAVVLVLAGGAYWRSHVQGPDVPRVLRAKSELALCTAYAANYAQRHPTGFTGNPFVDCQPLMQKVFGRPLPSVPQALTANPTAMVSFAGWNIREVPSAIALGLFGASPLGDNPGYTLVKLRSGYAQALSILLAIVIVAGLTMLVRDWDYWRQWLVRRRWALFVLGSVVIGNLLVVVLEERPWTEYTFALTVAALFAIGVCVSALLRRVVSMRVLAVIAAGTALALAVAIPPYLHPGPRPVHDGVERLTFLRGALDAPGAVMVASGYGQPICFYLAQSYNDYCTAQVWPVLRTQVSRSKPVETVIADTKASVIYADATLLNDPLLRHFLSTPAKYGWHRVAEGIGSDGPWRVLVTAPPS